MSLSPEDLRKKLADMVAYVDVEPETALVICGDDEWPGKEMLDVGWVYVAIDGDGYTEAVTVTITREEDKLVIRNIEWGRP